MGTHVAESEPTFYLNASDRCDQSNCGSRAYWRFVHRATLSELDFCHHHGKIIDAIIDHDAYIVFDESAQLDVKIVSGNHD